MYWEGCPADDGRQAAAEGEGDFGLSELLEFLARSLVDSPDEVEVERIDEDDDTVVLELSVAEEDRGKVIGRQGRTVRALRTIMRASGAGDDRRILVDPSLPPAALPARFNERTGLDPEAVTDVFCTTLRPVHRRGIIAFDNAKWWVNELELDTYRGYLEGLADSAGRLDQADAVNIETDLKLLERFRPAPEKFTPQVHLYPLLGSSPGSAGLLLTQPTATIIVAGDAALTAAHLQRGQVWQGCANTQSAMDSLQDIVEMADIVIPGHDNITLIGGKWT